MRIPKKAGDCPYPTVKALAAMVMADDDRAIRYVLAQLRANGGNVTATAKAIGCSWRSLYVWRDGVQRLREGFETHAMGRSGAGNHATAARLTKRAEGQEPVKRKATRRKTPNAAD